MPQITCGIDWAQDHHDIAIVDANGQLVAKRRIPESVAGFAELTAMLADASDDPDNPIPVAIDTPRGLLVAVLRAKVSRVWVSACGSGSSSRAVGMACRWPGSPSNRSECSCAHTAPMIPSAKR